ncbi:motile sperm domain-containing protein 2-like [Convolutriloba macropyga]|uniref:motile sperm domain-containing protein 2-like n=1 Tax=Convolutriloba macropyga TaxID=536237 RepID=UPI003F52634B
MPVLDIATVTDEQVSALRERFLKFEGEEIDEETKMPKKYDPRDIEDFKTDDTMVKFYITHGQANMDEAFRILTTSLEWRKTFSVREISFDAFPENVKASNAVSMQGTDKEGRRIIWMYMNRIKRTKGDLDIWSRYFVYHLEKLFQQRGTQRLIFVNDLSGVGITNFDYELTGFAVKLFENHYPDLLTFQVNYNMAWTLKTAWNIIKTWMTPEAIARVKFVKNDELQQYVCSEFIPTHMGGQFK